MLVFTEWVLNQKKKKKERKDERHNSQVGGESGHIHQQGEVAGLDSQEPTQAIHLFTVPEL
jgi:hypothetical protein